MPRALPPLNPLRSFEAAARHLNFTRAAKELGVTPTAVSRQVAVLEGFLDRPLFERRNSEVSLTEAGALYLAEVRPALERIVGATSHIRRRARTRLLIRCERSVALHWLAPYLTRFMQLRPTIGVEVSTRPIAPSAQMEADEIAIVSGGDAPDDATQIFLFEDRIAPVCAPVLMQRDDAPRTPADLLRQPLLASYDRWQAWNEWLAAAGVRESRTPAIGFDDANLLYDAAQRGLGFAIAPLDLVADLLRSGALVAPFAPVLRGASCTLAYRPASASAPVKDFALWLADEVKRARTLGMAPFVQAA